MTYDFVMKGKPHLYYSGCLKFIKRFEKKYHRKPDILETEKYILETYGDGVLLADSCKTIAMLLIECLILDGLFFDDKRVNDALNGAQENDF